MPPEIKRHFHRDLDVDRARIEAFVGEPEAVRLRVLAELRRRSGSDEFSMQLALVGILIAVVAAIVPAPEVAIGVPLLARLAASVATGLMATSRSAGPLAQSLAVAEHVRSRLR